MNKLVVLIFAFSFGVHVPKVQNMPYLISPRLIK